MLADSPAPITCSRCRCGRSTATGLRSQLRERRSRLAELQRREPERRRVHHDLRAASSSATSTASPSAHAAPRCRTGHRRPGDLALSDLEPVLGLPEGHQDRLAPQRLRGEVVHPGRPAGRAGRRRVRDTRGRSSARCCPASTRRRSPTLSAGTYPAWSADQVYVAGDRVLYNGVGYQAKWYTQGDRPLAPGSATPAANAPWQLLTS